MALYRIVLMWITIFSIEICVDSAVTCTVAGCTVCADGYTGPDCCDCAPDFYRSTDGTCQRKLFNLQTWYIYTILQRYNKNMNTWTNYKLTIIILVFNFL